MFSALLEVAREPFAPLDAIVVLGSPLGPGDAITPVLAERVAAAADLYHRGGGRIVVATGGVTRGATRAEADVMAGALAEAGVRDVVVERASLTTRDNAALTAPLLAARGARSAWIVTHPFHGRRAARLFRAAGVDAHVWHFAAAPPKPRWLVREYAAWLKLLGGRRR